MPKRVERTSRPRRAIRPLTRNGIDNGNMMNSTVATALLFVVSVAILTFLIVRQRFGVNYTSTGEPALVYSSGKIAGILISLSVHAAGYTFIIHPMSAAHGDEALAYALFFLCAYFPVSFLAWAVNGDAETLAGVMVLAGGLWYMTIGYLIGRLVDKSRMAGRE